MKANVTCPPLVVHAGEAPELQVLGVGVTFITESRHTAGAHSLMLNRVPEGAGPPRHWHEWDEAFYVLSGTITFMVGDDEVTGHPGSYVLAPAGVLHGFKGASSTPAQMLVFSVPAHAEGFFTEVDREMKAGKIDKARVLAIGEAHGIHFVLN